MIKFLETIINQAPSERLGRRTESMAVSSGSFHGTQSNRFEDRSHVCKIIYERAAKRKEKARAIAEVSNLHDALE